MPYILFMVKSENLINKIAYLTIDRHVCAHPKYIEGLQNMYIYTSVIQVRMDQGLVVKIRRPMRS